MPAVLGESRRYGMDKLNVLLLAVKPRGTANTLVDHIDAFKRHSRHRVRVFQNYLALIGPLGGRIQTIPQGFELDRFDVLVLHYSNYLALPSHMDPATRARIREFRGLKVVFIQDEYRTVNATVAALRELAVDVLYTCVPEAEVEKVYPRSALPGVRRISTITGFVPETLLRQRVAPLKARPIDVGYRSRMLPFWLGELAAEKWQIVPRFLEHTRDSGLRCDLSFREEDRIYGGQWTRFIRNCRTMLGVESGASVFDFAGEIQRQVDDYVAQNPGATFEEVQKKYLMQHEYRVRLNQISPRVFEAAALRTGMVLYEGEYSGMLKPDRHFIPLKKDFSNIKTVIDRIKDVASVQRMVDCTYEEVALNPRHSYRQFVSSFDNDVAEEANLRRSHGVAIRRTRGSPFSLQWWDVQAKFVLYRYVFLARMADVVSRIWGKLPIGLRDFLRPIARRAMRWLTQ